MWQWIIGALETWRAWRRVPDADIAAADAEAAKLAAWWERNRHRVSDGTADTGPESDNA